MLKESPDPSQPNADPAAQPVAPVSESPITRRVFVRAGGGMLIAATTEACISEGARSQKGAIRVILSGLLASATCSSSVRFSSEPMLPEVWALRRR